MIDQAMSRALEGALDRLLPRRGVPARLQAAMRYTLFNAGKRIRPALLLQLFKASTHLGALAARSPKAGNLARYGLHLGLAFQAVDDILDAHEKGRRNVACIYGMKQAQRLAAREVAAAKAAVRFMGVNGERLRQIADFVVSRKH